MKYANINPIPKLCKNIMFVIVQGISPAAVSYAIDFGLKFEVGE
jgi:hypothetical protein